MELSPAALLERVTYDLASALPDVDLQSIDWWSGDARVFAAQYLRREVVRKYRHATNEARERIALEKFLTINNRCGVYELQLRHEHEAEVHGLVKDCIYRFFYDRGNFLDSYPRILAHGAVGPGASLEALGTDFYTKLFSSPFVVYSPRSYSAYESYTNHLPLWKEAESLRRSSFGRCSHIDANRLSFVPKDDRASRTICTEPALEMFIQLGIGNLISDRLKSFFGIVIDGESNQQVHNRELARRGSLDGSFATIDLSSASDSLSLSLMRELLPANIYGMLMHHRATYSQLPDGSRVVLNMISTMGNGFTFPLQTLLFSSVVSACYRYLGLHKAVAGCGGTFGVFGDDICIVKEAFRLVTRMLELYGFTLNADKTFVEGPFRESCGADFYNGQNVRPVYVKDLSTPASRHVAVNLLNEWSAAFRIPLCSAVRLLSEAQPFRAVPCDAPLDSGIRLPFSLTEGIRRNQNGSCIYYPLLARADSLACEEDRIVVSRGRRQRIYNPSGLYLAFLRGAIRDCRIHVRPLRVSYRARRMVTPNWDHYPDASTRWKVEWQRWETAVWRNHCWPE